MIRLSKKLLFALEAVLDIAYNAGTEPVRSKEITRRQGIPQRYLEQVMQRLVRAGVLKGVRGPRGGYLLARERRRISLSEIARVVNDMETNRNRLDDWPASDFGHRVVRPLWHELEKDFMGRLEGISIEDLCQRARDNGIESEAGRRLDYSI